MHHIMEQGYHGLLVGRLSILQAEWHDAASVDSPIGGEHCLGFFLFSILSHPSLAREQCWQPNQSRLW